MNQTSNATAVATKVWSLFNGRVIVFGYGANTGGNNWSMRQVERDLFQNLITNRVNAFANNQKTKRFFSPTPSSCNKEVVRAYDNTGAPSKEFSGEFTLPSGELLYRGVDADGVSGLLIGDGYAVSPADCPTIFVLTKSGNLICAHAGRDSILDIPSKENSFISSSVVTSIANKIKYDEIAESEVHIGFSSISAGPHFSHNPNDAKYPQNRAIIDYLHMHYGKEAFASRNGKVLRGAIEGGHIDLLSILILQLHRIGFRRIEVDETCTYFDKDPSGNFLWHSNRRNRGTSYSSHRNLLVAHHVG